MGAERGQHQHWRFLVVKDPEIKKKVQVYYQRLYDETVGPGTRPAHRRRAATPTATSASMLLSNT